MVGPCDPTPSKTTEQSENVYENKGPETEINYPWPLLIQGGGIRELPSSDEEGLGVVGFCGSTPAKNDGTKRECL